MFGLKPKDFDVVTDATPEQIKGLFRNCRLIGRRFRLAHIVFGRDVIEVATFRGHHQESDPDDSVLDSEKAKSQTSQQSTEGQLIRDNVFGTIEEDAERRDFTFNAMYYNIADFSVRDFAGGVQAVEKREVEMIGDPEKRYREDPVRMLRAIRFAGKLDFSITPRTRELIPELADLLSNIAPARLFEEVIKLFINGDGVKTFELMQEYHLFSQLFPQIQPLLENPDGKEYRFLLKVLTNTDNRINSGMRVTPAFFYAAVMWYAVEERQQQHMAEGGFNPHDAFVMAMNDVLHRQMQRIMIPKRFSSVIRDIWLLQHRLPKRFGKRAYVTLEHARFRAAYDFLVLRGEVEGGELAELGQWWTEFQDATPVQRKKRIADLRSQDGKSPRRKRHYRNRKPPQQ
jgi:poly(A) polymerase